MFPAWKAVCLKRHGGLCRARLRQNPQICVRQFAFGNLRSAICVRHLPIAAFGNLRSAPSNCSVRQFAFGNLLVLTRLFMLRLRAPAAHCESPPVFNYCFLDCCFLHSSSSRVHPGRTPLYVPVRRAVHSNSISRC